MNHINAAIQSFAKKNHEFLKTKFSIHSFKLYYRYSLWCFLLFCLIRRVCTTCHLCIFSNDMFLSSAVDNFHTTVALLKIPVPVHPSSILYIICSSLYIPLTAVIKGLTQRDISCEGMWQVQCDYCTPLLLNHDSSFSPIHLPVQSNIGQLEWHD